MKNPAAEDHNMFVCGMFLELGHGIVWNLNVHGTLMEPSVLEFCSGVLALLVPLCSFALQWFSCCGLSPWVVVHCCLDFVF